MAAKKKTVEGLSPLDQIQSYLKDHKDEHFNFEKEPQYVVSSGSLLLDIEMSGGIRPSIIRASGVSEGGKTSCALSFAKNFQDSVENSMVVYIKSEGRLSPEMLGRSGLDVSPEKLFIYKSNIFESVLQLMRELIMNNPTECKYFFIIDSMDAMVPKKDLDRSFEESDKVAGGSVLSSNFLKKMALGLSTKGHICFMISQVRSKVSLNQYEKTDPKLTNASGGNALLHYSDWILEFQPRYGGDMIPPKDDKPEGHYCKIIFRKTANEKTGTVVRYPIKYGRTGGRSVWVEYEVLLMLLQWKMAEAKGAWIIVADELIEELKKAGLEMDSKHQGMDNFRKYLEREEEICKYLFKKLKTALEGIQK
jgi:RecA/RadA recombinase